MIGFNAHFDSLSGVDLESGGEIQQEVEKPTWLGFLDANYRIRHVHARL